MNSISDRIIKRELSDGSNEKRERIIGKRLKEGYAHYKRYLEILSAISRNGFGSMLGRLKNVQILPKVEETSEKVKNFSRGERLRLLFEDLGPTFIKIGQIMSTRPDLVPEEYLAELSKLTDTVKPMARSDVRTIFESELGGSFNKIFAKFDEKPVGSASIGQVHRAETKNGEFVAVKIQRPMIKNKIMVDMEILEDLADMFGDITGISEVIDPLELVLEFKRHLTRELDYTIEARSIDHFKRDFSKIDEVIIPAVYWEYTTKRVLVMDFAEGIKIDDVKKNEIPHPKGCSISWVV